MQWAKLSTAISVAMGPFLSTDGTRLTGLTMSSNVIRARKNNGLWANRNGGLAVSTGSGWYSVPLTATDMNTKGPLRIKASTASGLDMVEDFMVLPAVVYNALVAGSAGSLVTSAANMRGTDSALLSTNVPTNFNALSINASGYITKTLTASVTSDTLKSTTAYEGTLTVQDFLRLGSAVLYGKSGGGGTANLNFYASDGSTVRVSTTVDSNGNRTTVTKLDAT